MKEDNDSLFADEVNETPSPLAERMRPGKLEDYAGQEHLTGEGKPLRVMSEKGELSSMILWGPPGTGKTTLALILAKSSKTDFIQLSAVSSGVKDIRAAIDRAELNRSRGKKTILFIDEIHRFSKSQQDALLHAVEKGTLTLIGATTENPSFEVIPPLISRARVYVLKDLGKDALFSILDNTLKNDVILGKLDIEIEDRNFLAMLSGGDARKMLGGLELAVNLSKQKNAKITITNERLKEAFQSAAKYDKGGEEHYNIISAFIKSMRGGDPDAAVYWLARMIEGGEDPLFIARRMVILASEDVGNADPYALTLAVSCFNAVNVIGMPEARIILSQAATYLASSPKSNASYMAINEAMEDVKNLPPYDVPLHLRNAPTKLMKELGYGKEYKYAHNYKEGEFEQQHLPEELKDKKYYRK